MFLEEADGIDGEIMEVLVHVLFRGATKNDFERVLIWGFHDILWIAKHKYKLSYKEQLFVIFKMAEYSDTIAYMKAYRCYNNIPTWQLKGEDCYVYVKCNYFSCRMFRFIFHFN